MIKQEQISPEHQKLLLEIGSRIKQLRTNQTKGYIETANEIGVSRNTYNLLELGRINFQFSTLLQVLDYYEISLSEFFKDCS